MKNILLSLIRAYQKLTPIRKSIFVKIFSINTSSYQGTCRFSPTCSDYIYQAIERYGIVKGILLAVKRISKCHPWSKGGFDPVINQKPD